MLKFIHIARIGLFTTFVVLAGCVGQPTHVMTTSFDPNDVAWAKRDGGNSVVGFAVLRTQGGEARTCAGTKVYLTPDSAYARERMMKLYGSLVQGSVGILQATKFKETDSQYFSASRETLCDGQGNFSLEKVADGTWYVLAGVIWVVGGAPQGGYLMKRVELRGNQAAKVTLP